MNKSYLIVPAVMLAGFAPVYRTASARMQAHEDSQKQQAALAVAAEDAKRQDLDRKAEADARARQDEHDRLDREATEKKLADYAEVMRRLATERDGYVADADKYATEVKSLETQIADLRTKKEAANKEVFALTREVELPKIERRTAELEIQRTYAIVASRFAASGLAGPPPTAPAK